LIGGTKTKHQPSRLLREPLSFTGNDRFWPVVLLAGHNNNWHSGHVERQVTARNKTFLM
jgi:hypothetical protein